MLVNDCMTRHPIMISQSAPATEVQQVMSENKIRHLPVVGDGKRLQGLITRQCLSIKPDVLSSLNVWEISRYLSNLTAKQVMIKRQNVHTIASDRAVERAARMMSDHKVGCLPVVEDDVVVGILSEVDLMHAFQQMLGFPAEGVRLTMRMPNKPGEFTKLTSVIAEQGWGVMGIGTFPARRHEGYYDAVFKLVNVPLEEAKRVFSEVPGQELIDCRDAV